MLFTTVEHPTKREIPYDVIGFADGITIRGISAWKQAFSNFKSMFGGNLEEVEAVFVKIRRDAIQKCLDRAEDLGADELIGLRIDVSEISTGANSDGLVSVYAYGTAIRYKLSDADAKRVARRRPQI